MFDPMWENRQPLALAAVMFSVLERLATVHVV